jgi:hypothetical protein
VAGQLQRQFVGRPEAQNAVVLRMLSQCAGVMALHPEVPVGSTACLQVYRDCRAALEENLRETGAGYPAWLRHDEGHEAVEAVAPGSRGPKVQMMSQEEYLAQQKEAEEREWRERKAANKARRKKEGKSGKGKKKKGGKKRKKKKKKEEL